MKSYPIMRVRRLARLLAAKHIEMAMAAGGPEIDGMTTLTDKERKQVALELKRISARLRKQALQTQAGAQYAEQSA